MKKMLELLLILAIPLVIIALVMHFHHKEGGCGLHSGKKDKKSKKHHLW